MRLTANRDSDPRESAHRSKILAYGLVLLAACASARGDHGKGETSAPVPPSREIEILDPGIDPNGNPKVLLSADRSKVEIPPTVLVHRYYYTGDRDFQAPLLKGGPCILVVNNPKDGQRRYIDAMLPPGSPRVYYRPNSITYEYKQQSVILKFDHKGYPRIVYEHGKTMLAKARETTNHVIETPHRVMEKSGASAAAREVKTGTGEVTAALHDGVKEGARMATLPPTRIVESLPFMQAIRDSKRFRAERARVDSLEKAGAARIASESSVKLIP